MWKKVKSREKQNKEAKTEAKHKGGKEVRKKRWCGL